jgi:hypothetical protein
MHTLMTVFNSIVLGATAGQCRWKGVPHRSETRTDLQATLAGWIHEIVQAQPVSFQALPKEEREALIELEITRRFYAERDANPELDREFREFLRLRKQRN